MMPSTWSFDELAGVFFLTSTAHDAVLDVLDALAEMIHNRVDLLVHHVAVLRRELVRICLQAGIASPGEELEAV
jgi:hypothetical protein